MRRLEHDRRRNTGVERLLPAARRTTHQRSPGHEPREAPLGMRRREVVADRGAEVEELLRHHGADGVDAEVLTARPAAAIAEEPGQRVDAARLERARPARSDRRSQNHCMGARLEPGTHAVLCPTGHQPAATQEAGGRRRKPVRIRRTSDAQTPRTPRSAKSRQRGRARAKRGHHRSARKRPSLAPIRSRRSRTRRRSGAA